MFCGVANENVSVGHGVSKIRLSPTNQPPTTTTADGSDAGEEGPAELPSPEGNPPPISLCLFFVMVGNAALPAVGSVCCYIFFGFCCSFSGGWFVLSCLAVQRGTPPFARRLPTDQCKMVKDLLNASSYSTGDSWFLVLYKVCWLFSSPCPPSSPLPLLCPLPFAPAVWLPLFGCPPPSFCLLSDAR